MHGNVLGLKHGKLNEKNGMPFHYDMIFIYGKGISLNSIQQVILRPWSPPMGLSQTLYKICASIILWRYV